MSCLISHRLSLLAATRNTEQERGTHLDNGNDARLLTVTVVEEGLLAKLHGSQEIPCLSGVNERL